MLASMREMYPCARASCCSGGRSTSRGASIAAAGAPKMLDAGLSTPPVRAAATLKTPSVIALATSSPVILIKRIGRSLPQQSRDEVEPSIGEPDLWCQRDQRDEKPFGFSAIRRALGGGA